MPGTPITDEDRKKIDAKFICTSCNLLLCMPMQTSCGHLMCYSCLQALLSGCAKCPADGEDLVKEEVFPDTFTRRELKRLHLHCPNPGCPWHGLYEELELHSNTCDFSIIRCVHEECKETFQRSHLGKHLKSDCEYRNVKCEYCGQEGLSLASIKEHIGTICEAAPVTCKYCKLEMLRKDLKHHEEQICEEIPAKCAFGAVGCKHNKVLKQKELREHSKDGLINHVWLVLQFVLTLASQLTQCVPRLDFLAMVQNVRDEISEVRLALAEKFVTLLEKMTGMERRLESLESTGGRGSRMQAKVEDLEEKGKDMDAEVACLRERTMNLEQEIREKTSTINRLKNRIDQLDESLALNAVKISDLELARDSSQIIHSNNGTLLWKIDQFQRKRQDAISGVKTAQYSPPFYSSQFGYKMGAKIYLNGDGFGKGTHLSLFFVVMKGEYDALQTWPFQKKITMMLLDQGNRDHMIDAFHSDPQSSSFQRPKSDMNIASGSPLFMPIEGLQNATYIKDDVIFIKIIVD